MSRSEVRISLLGIFVALGIVFGLQVALLPIHAQGNQDQAEAAAAPNKSGPDFDPANPPANFWTNNGERTFYSEIDNNGNYQQFKTYTYLATQNLIATHDQDSTKTNQPHWHAKDDFTGNDKTFATNYWDARFGASDKPPKTTSKQNPTTKTNCFAYALATFTKAGTYNYWIDDGLMVNAVDAAFTADTVSHPINEVQINDVLYYWRNEAPYHATGVTAVHFDEETEESNPQTLEWKFNASPIYSYNVEGTYDTPDSIPTPPLVGQPIEWKWVPAGAGAQSELNPTGNVRRNKND